MSGRSKNFTLIEILVVVSVIVILAGITIGGANLAFKKSTEAAIKARMRKMEMALEQHRKDWGYYPIQSAANVELNFPLVSPDNVPYLEESTQPYGQTEGGRPLRYQYPGSHNTEKYDLWASGADEDFDANAGGDDITNWTQR